MTACDSNEHPVKPPRGELVSYYEPPISGPGSGQPEETYGSSDRG